MTEYVYAQIPHPLAKGREFRNPRFFTEVEGGSTAVWVIGDFPNIVDAYKAAGVPVTEIDPASAATGVQFAGLPDPFKPHTAEERARVPIPVDWADLPWSRPITEGLSLRALATVFSDEPIMNKAQATETLQTEVDGRTAGLTKSEIIADLEAMGVSYDPRLNKAELLEMRNAGWPAYVKARDARHAEAAE